MSGDEDEDGDGGGSRRDWVTGVVSLVELQEECVNIAYIVTEKDEIVAERERRTDRSLTIPRSSRRSAT